VTWGAGCRQSVPGYSPCEIKTHRGRVTQPTPVYEKARHATLLSATLLNAGAACPIPVERAAPRTCAIRAATRNAMLTPRRPDNGGTRALNCTTEHPPGQTVSCDYKMSSCAPRMRARTARRWDARCWRVRAGWRTSRAACGWARAPAPAPATPARRSSSRLSVVKGTVTPALPLG